MSITFFKKIKKIIYSCFVLLLIDNIGKVEIHFKKKVNRGAIWLRNYHLTLDYLML